MTASTLARARLLVASVRAALINGCRHYDGAGRLLGTEQEILQALSEEGRVLVDEADRTDRTTVREQEALLRQASPRICTVVPAERRA